MVTKEKTWYISCKNDEELYSWMDEIYQRLPLTGVSNPTNFAHNVHVGFDPNSGGFTGLPDQWADLLSQSKISKEDYKRDPQAVLEVLEFYTHQQKAGMGMMDTDGRLQDRQMTDMSPSVDAVDGRSQIGFSPPMGRGPPLMPSPPMGRAAPHEQGPPMDYGPLPRISPSMSRSTPNIATPPMGRGPPMMPMHPYDRVPSREDMVI
ncbi:MAG: P21-Rho-binding domain-containing protein [Olpidium bornovanus]|uniref:non-specific serine/threonine protein kinase n=1 Tax=Olpidium bornovanus TaxID=278681 RepID=A0A8H7ZU06_9FUNG|nr:MAG: P21-Rho-binding domain-containing protein [Olpidium bornovanus]